MQGREDLCASRGKLPEQRGGRCQRLRSDEDRLGMGKHGDWDVTGDLFTVSTRMEIEKRFQMFCFLKKNQCNLALVLSIQPSSRSISELEDGIWTFYLLSP